MITEYDVLNVLSECNGATCDEISSSTELADRRATYKLVEILKAAQLIKPAFRQDNDQAYSITPAGQYRLQQLKERLDYQQKAAEDAEKQRKTAKEHSYFTAIIGALTLAVGIVAAVAAILPLILK